MIGSTPRTSPALHIDEGIALFNALSISTNAAIAISLDSREFEILETRLFKDPWFCPFEKHIGVRGGACLEELLL